METSTLRVMRSLKISLCIVLLLDWLNGSDSIKLYGEAPTVAGIFTDHMVLQSNTQVPVWGRADSGSEIQATFANQVKSTRAGPKGKWIVWFDPLPISHQGKSLTVESSHIGFRREFKDVLVGEVWFCSGQSNTNMNLYKVHHAATEIALSGNRNLRWYTIRNDPNPDAPDDDAQGEWVLSDPATAWEFSAVGYYFAEALQDQLDVPVGVIQGAMGGTPVEAWISLPSLQENPAGKELLSFWKDQMNGFTYADNPNENMAALLKLGFPGGYFNGRVAPAIPYAIKGAIWYQGESNRFRAGQYAELFPLMIRDWRSLWKQGDFPFYYVQLANIGEEDNRESEWPMLQFVQTQTLKLPNTGMAVANDSVHVNLHPRDKKQVGQRLALWALAKTYKRAVPFSGPIYNSMVVEGDRIRVHFDYADKGLFIRGNPKIYHPSVLRKAPLILTGFEIRGATTDFMEADAQIEGQTVVISHPDIKKPTAARYAWTSNATSANLTNHSGLPASLFRTDSERLPVYQNKNPFKRKL